MFVLFSGWRLQRAIHCPTVALASLNMFVLENQVNNMLVDGIVCLELMTVTQAPLGNDDLYRLFHIKKNLGLQRQIHGAENKGMSVQLLGNKYEEDNSGREISGLGRERERA